jgi:hypothetical protein
LPSSLDPLFSERPLKSLIEEQWGRVRERLAGLSDDELLLIPLDDILEQVYQEFSLPPLKISHENAASKLPREFTHYKLPNGKMVELRGFAYEVEFPFVGASGLVRHQPSRADKDPPRAKAHTGGYRGSISIIVSAANATLDMIKMAVQEELGKVERYIGFQALELDPYNAALRADVRLMLERRKKVLLDARNIASSLGYPLKKRDDAPETFTMV